MFIAVWVDSRRRLAVSIAALVVLAGLGVGAYLLIHSRGKHGPAPAPAPRVVTQRRPKAAQDLGFPAFATKNTTRVAGADPIADAAGVALAVFPSSGGVAGPAAVTLVDAKDGPSGIAAASLMAAPVGAPILITDGGSVPSLTADALRALAPAGSPATQGRQAFVVGSAAAPSGLHAERISGGNAAELAAAIARLRERLTGHPPEHIVLASSASPQFAMPAAAWAARSGDPVLFVGRTSAPKATLNVLRHYREVPVYALGPRSVISDQTLRQVKRVSPPVKRVGGGDPVTNSVQFARYLDGTFGWDIRDPGHGFVIASDSRPLDAAAAAALSASGDWGPLLLTDDPAQTPAALRGYLLDVKPGYISDPTRAVYNHVWLIGDQSAISVAFQAAIDDLAEVARVRSGAGTSLGGVPVSPKHKQARPPKR
jgi:hypothetical protein